MSVRSACLDSRQLALSSSSAASDVYKRQVVQGGVLLVATVIIIVNVGVDLLYGLINPRIRHVR